jgi:hypothetical protein
VRRRRRLGIRVVTIARAVREGWEQKFGFYKPINSTSLWKDYNDA